jgi:hypothetical protein
LYKGVRNLFTSVDWGDDYEEGAARDYEAELAIANIAFFV